MTRQCGAMDLRRRSPLLDGPGILQPILPFHVRRQKVHSAMQKLHFHLAPTGQFEFDEIQWKWNLKIKFLFFQEKAAKLSTCVCDGTEDYDCPSILDNMDRLCYHKVRPSSSATTAGPAPDQTPAEGGGLGVEERNDTTSSGSGDRTGHGGHHPGHQPHPPRTRPHHPHHSPPPPPPVDVTEGIESNEVERQTQRPPATGRLPSSAPPSSYLVAAGLLPSLLFLAVFRPAL